MLAISCMYGMLVLNAHAFNPSSIEFIQHRKESIVIDLNSRSVVFYLLDEKTAEEAWKETIITWNECNDRHN
jgi:hypothetical protein